MTYTIHHGDCLEWMRGLPSNSVDSVITDPPYGLSAPPDMRAVLRGWLEEEEYAHNGKGFMGKAWDSFVPGPRVWAEVYRVLKPGGTALVFAGTRTFDLMSISVRLAGFVPVDCIGWCYGSGFPKSLDISKALDKEAGAEREAKRVEYSGNAVMRSGGQNTRPWMEKALVNGYHELPGDTPATPLAKLWQGWGTALKPAWEPILVMRKPCDGTFATNAWEHGVAGLWIDGCRVGTTVETWPASRRNGSGDGRTCARGHGDAQTVRTGDVPPGRWPANIMLDEEAAAVLDAQSGRLTSGKPSGRRNATGYAGGLGEGKTELTGFGDSGGASRFFYVAKSSPSDRNYGMPHGKRNTHPTVKPLALMRQLARLTRTPTGGTVLDPFAGSFSTAVAAILEGRDVLACDMEAEHCEIGRYRCAFAAQQVSPAPEYTGDLFGEGQPA